jgi:dihydrodipicolinate synthase/N-acetylneuraminate lyase
VIREADRTVDILGAVGKYFHENLASNAIDGTSSGAFNYALEPMMEHIAVWKAGDVIRATKIWSNELAELHEYVFSDFGRLHVRYKVGAWLRSFIVNPLIRPPIPKPRRVEVSTMTTLLTQSGMSVIEKHVIDEFCDHVGIAP